MIPKLSGYELPSPEECPKSKVSWTIDPSRAALLIHDMQDYFLNFWGPDSKLVKELVQNIKLLKAMCKALNIPVFYTAQPIEQDLKDRALLNDMWGPGISRYPELQSITSELAPEKDDIQLTKWRYSAFARSPFLSNLREQGRDQLIICGVYAHIGCLATATDAFSNDIQPFMVADALADFSREKHDIALSMAAGICGRVESVKSITQQFVEQDLRKLVASLIEDEGDDEWPEDDENLVDYGLDSVKIMALASRWQTVYPEIGFNNLAQKPNLASWRKMLLSN